MRSLKFSVILLSLCLSSAFSSSVDNHLNQFFNGLGYQTNTTTPAAYQGQAAGYFSGGSLYLRNEVSNYQLMSAEMPSFGGSCSGIDAFFGSFSVISSAQLGKMLKNILSAGGAYAMDLALTTTVPQIKSVKDYIQKFVNDINAMNISSCNTAEDLVGGLWPKTQSAQQQICRDLGSHGGPFHDWAEARQRCGAGGEFTKGIGDGGKRKAEIIVNKNLVWDALMQNTFTAEDTTFAEVLMSLSGTLIVKNKSDGSVEKNQAPSLVNTNFIKALLAGGESITIYHCDELKKCLNPTKSTIPIAVNQALVNRVAKMINTLNRDVISDTGALTAETRGFLEMTPIPILKLITTEAALGRALDTVQYSEVIAVSLLDQYLMENIKVVKEALAIEDTPMDVNMEKQIDTAQGLVTQALTSGYQRLQNTSLLIRNMRAMEQQLSSRIANQTASTAE